RWPAAAPCSARSGPCSPCRSARCWSTSSPRPGRPTSRAGTARAAPSPPPRAPTPGRRAPTAPTPGPVAPRRRRPTRATPATPTPDGGRPSAPAGRAGRLRPGALLLEGGEHGHEDLLHVVVEEATGPEQHGGADVRQRGDGQEGDPQVLVVGARHGRHDERRGRLPGHD